jgi:hypothetical protein
VAGVDWALQCGSESCTGVDRVFLIACLSVYQIKTKNKIFNYLFLHEGENPTIQGGPSNHGDQQGAPILLALTDENETAGKLECSIHYTGIDLFRLFYKIEI